MIPARLRLVGLAGGAPGRGRGGRPTAPHTPPALPPRRGPPPARASANLDTAGFRAVGVAHSANAISAVAIAPDGRLFATVQALAATQGKTPGTSEIRVYQAYKDNDGSVFDEGIVWATVDGVRATTLDNEGVLGIALAPDFASSKLVYVYLTTTDEDVNQHVRVYREKPDGTGEYVTTISTSLEPPAEQTARSGGALAFGVDNCLLIGVGDNGGANRWMSQLLVGTDPVTGAETNAYCTDVCLGTTEYPDRTITDDGNPNFAGKVIRLSVDGTTAAPAPGGLIPGNPVMYGTGLRNPTTFGVHPLTGQLWVSERADTQRAELDVLDNGTNAGWPCLEGDVINTGVAGCLTGRTPADVYANHPTWRRPIVTHGNPVPIITGVAAYTGLAYPDAFYGDMFYLLRDSARIYRVDLEPPCFLPHPGGVTPIKLHDSNTDGDFTVFGDFNNDPKTIEQLNATALIAIAQGPDPQGRQVLYVVGKQGTNNFTDDSIIFRIEFASQFTPYQGPMGRVADSCFTDGVYSGGTGPAPYAYENPFLRGACVAAGGACNGQPDGTSCDDGQVCNGAETCQGGVCRAGTPPADGTTCQPMNGCLQPGTCQNASCVAGPPVADGTPCPDSDACNGLETCAGGVCQPGTGPQGLTVNSVAIKTEKKPGSGAVVLSGSIKPVLPVAPDSRDEVGLQIAGSSETVSPSKKWKRSKPPKLFLYRGGSRGLSSVRLKADASGGFAVLVKATRLHFEGLEASPLNARLIVGDQCFAADLGCQVEKKRMRCR